MTPATPVPPSFAPLFVPLKLGRLSLAHRVVMAPMSCRLAAHAEGIPSPRMVLHYGQRASPGGLIIAEAAPVSCHGRGHRALPGLHTVEQSNHWQCVTRAVKAGGGVIVAQLWHAGPAMHAPTASEIDTILDDYRNAAEHAGDAGFDGIEIHAAHGGLLDRLLQDGTQPRLDRLREVIDAVASVWSPGRVGVRLSPAASIDGSSGVDALPLFSQVLREIGLMGVAYVDLVEPRCGMGRLDSQAGWPLRLPALFRALRPEALISSGGHDVLSASRAVADGHADAVAFGRAFLANPDLVRRLRLGVPLVPFSGGMVVSRE